MSENLTESQARTLTTLVRAGGRVDDTAGQPGMNQHSVRALQRKGFLVREPICSACRRHRHTGADMVCEYHSGSGCTASIRITDAGRDALQPRSW